MRINLKAFDSVIYVFNDFELLEYFKDNNERLQPNFQNVLPENNNNNFTKKLNNLIENVIYKDIEDFKSNCEDGWELFEFGEDNNFSLEINIASYYDFVNNIFNSIFKSYK